jgi:hypothetical protein
MHLKEKRKIESKRYQEKGGRFNMKKVLMGFIAAVLLLSSTWAHPG